MSDDFDQFLKSQRRRVRRLLGVPTERRIHRGAEEAKPMSLHQTMLANVYAAWEIDQIIHGFRNGGCQVKVRR